MDRMDWVEFVFRFEIFEFRFMYIVECEISSIDSSDKCHEL